jgi:hypothetical protein
MRHMLLPGIIRTTIQIKRPIDMTPPPPPCDNVSVTDEKTKKQKLGRKKTIKPKKDLSFAAFGQKYFSGNENELILLSNNSRNWSICMKMANKLALWSPTLVLNVD